MHSKALRPYLNATDIQIIPVTCVGMIHPNLLAKTLDAGAAEVMVVGCPPEDCANREGNLIFRNGWMGSGNQSCDRNMRVPQFELDWLAPNAFDAALNPGDDNTSATAYAFFQ